MCFYFPSDRHYYVSTRTSYTSREKNKLFTMTYGVLVSFVSLSPEVRLFTYYLQFHIMVKDGVSSFSAVRVFLFVASNIS